MEWFFGNPIFAGFVFVIGACVGSFLNVVIYRVPRGLGVSDPKRSFCPKCKKEIPGYRNLPIITWVIQRGKCAECKAPIAFRYCLVEILTGVLFLLAFLTFDPAGSLLVMALVVILISIGFIDAELMVIPVNFCWVGMGIGLLGGVVAPGLVLLPEAPQATSQWLRWEGGWQSLLGLALGWGLLTAVVHGGKLVFGAKKMTFPEARKWLLREPENEEEELCFVLVGEDGAEEEAIGWSELFFRAKDRIEIQGHGILLDGKSTKATEAVIWRDRVEINGKTHTIEQLAALSGKAERVIIPREAMGSGDPPLLGMIGAFLGWQGVLFTLFSSCVYAIVAAILGRIGFGRALPFGPFLALGCLTWVFGGWKWWEAYFAFVQNNVAR